MAIYDPTTGRPIPNPQPHPAGEGIYEKGYKPVEMPPPPLPSGGPNGQKK